MCAILTFAGCTKTNNESQSQPIEVEASTSLDRFIDGLLAEYPNAMNNDVTRATLADTIKSRINHHQGGQIPFLVELPLEYEMCLPYNAYSKYAGQYVVKFSYSGRGDNRTTTFQVLTRMDKEEVAKLVDHAHYMIDGTFLFYPDSSQDHWFELPSGRGITDNPKINVTTTLDNSQKPFINLGTWILKDVSFIKLQN